MSARDTAQSMARQAFDAGLRAAPQPAAERERQRTYVIGYAGDLVAAHIEAAVSAGGQAQPAPALPAQDAGAIEEQIAAIEDAEEYRTRTLAWRRGRVGWNRAREAANERGMAAALATLKALRGGAA